MNPMLTPTLFIIITVEILCLTNCLRGDIPSQSPLSDDQISNYSHQNETEDFESDNLFGANSLQHPEEDEGWSDWSEWSTCSRSCDGGISISLRKCNSKKGCVNGNSEKYKICNMQPCPTLIDFGATQCSTYNNRPYRGILYEWLPYRDPLDPCSLTCKARKFNFVAKLAPRLEDGTRCRDGSLDMCVAGKCLPVGCDLQLGSENKVDDCGICGGDGSSCKRPTYIWNQTNYSPCSVSCGGGYQMSHPICIDKEAIEQVDEILCDISTRPKPHITECNAQKCPPFWIIEAWTNCNQECGGGKQIRDVYCVQDGVNGTRIKVSDHNCLKQKPVTERSCNTKECPQWFEGLWTECSVTCGKGYQTRPVVCRDIQGFYSDECSYETKPIEKQICSNELQCLNDSINSKENSQEDSPRLPYHLPWVQKLTNPSISTEPNFIVGEWSLCSTSCGKGIRKRRVECKIFLEFSRTVVRLPDTQCPGNKPNDFEVCTVRKCNDDIDDESLDDNSDEEEEKNNDIISTGVEKPANKMIPLSKINNEINYYWKSAGFTECTASCLGGTQESIINCIKAKDQSMVNPYLCNINNKPDSFTRTCNDHPCPPRWNVTEFGVCSKDCGGGVQIREIQCVHEVTRGTANTIIVSNHQCQEAMPRTRQFCNVFDCPPQWKTEPWTKCSQSCGGGVKTRKLKCIKELAFGQLIEQPSSKCPAKRPKVMKVCNSKQCRNPLLELRKVLHQSKAGTDAKKVDDNVFIQKMPKKKITLKVSGEAIVFEGTLVRMRCPRRKADKRSNHTQWFKDDIRIVVGSKLQFTGKNTLRIKKIDFSDSGIYSCTWNNRTVHKLDLQVRQVYRSDDDKTVEQNLNVKNSKPINPNYGKVIKNQETMGNNGWINNKIFMRSKPKRANRRQNIDRSVFSDSAQAPNQDSSLDTWEVNHGNPSQSEEFDQKLVNGNSFMHSYSRVNKSKDSSEEKFRGEANVDSISQLQKLLSNTKKEKKDSIYLSSDEVLHDDYVTDNIDNNKSEAHLIANAFILGKGDANKLKFNWITNDWSSCTISCGGSGFQVRASQCYVTYENITKTVDSNFCIDAGLDAPQTIRNCGLPECPVWETGQWSDCNECINLKTALQKREVKCVLSNGTVLEDKECESGEKPNDRRECVDQRCEGIWTVDQWSECNGKCEEEGFQSRIIQCVWFNTTKPAGNACKDKSRPEVLQPCMNRPCSDNICVDKSKHCNLAKSLNMCRISHYRHQCCASCLN